MNKRVYIETTIPSYLAARPGRDLIQAARQQITHAWWNAARENYDLCISQIVLEEAASGDAEAARMRLLFLDDLPLLDLTEAVNDVAKAIVASGLLPREATRDAIHIAVASVHGVDFLVTWNCRHIANAAIMRELQKNRRGLWLSASGVVYARGIAWRVKAMKQDDIETIDEIIQETRRIKGDLARSMDFNIDRILSEAKRKQQESGRIAVSPPAPQSR